MSVTPTLTTGTNGGAAIVANLLYNATEPSRPDLFLAAFTGTPPTDSTIAEECSDANYLRYALDRSKLTVSGRTASNNVKLTWSAAFVDAQSIADMGVVTSGTVGDGSMLEVKVTTEGPIEVAAGDVLEIEVGGLTFTVGAIGD
jgi:hypothetical protein